MQLPASVRARVAVLLLVLSDVIALVGALALSFILRFDGASASHVYQEHIHQHLYSIPLMLVIYVSAFALFRLYKYAWRFASLETARGTVIAASASLVAFALLQWLVDGSTFPRSVLIIFWMTSIISVGGLRVLLRLASLSSSYGGRAVRILQRDLRPRRIVILGGGSDGARVLNVLREEHCGSCEVVGFLDDNPAKRGVYIRDVRVIGPLSKLYALLEDKAVDEVLIALPGASGAEIREYTLACRRQKVPVKIVPDLRAVLNGKAPVRIEDISVEDLLRRPPVRINVAAVDGFISGKRVLVTGAGGSIGSELCRQIVRLKPTSLVLLGHGENSIHTICQELRDSFPTEADRLRIVIASVADEARINQVFHDHRPEIVFHTAAHKHVPIMENNVVEAVQNNVLGTGYVAEACGRYRVGHMLLISSDKAVFPSSVMGGTKWLCERIVHSMVPIYRDTSYVTVRFGNVLGSRGSVVRIFHEQIKHGGPVTVTHRDMTRYFMSIPEAAQLVLQACASGRSGELYLLDMGEPVRIVDLAHDMIQLCGYEPDKDIKIVFSGPRPGEKLHESLTNDDEALEPAFCDGLSIVSRPDCYSASEVMDMLRRVQQLVVGGDAGEAYEFLSDTIPGFAERTLIGR